MKLKSGGAGSAFASTAGALSGVEKLKSRLGASTAAASLIVDSGAAVSGATVVSAGLGVKSNVKSSGLTSSAGLALGFSCNLRRFSFYFCCVQNRVRN